jgi:MerR family copper efflux transcriptional regulator
MADTLTIGQVSRLTGVPAKTIRFYEAEGVIVPPSRSDAGYRRYSSLDVRRLRLARRARLLGLSLADVKVLVDQAFRSDCLEFGDQVLTRIADQREHIDQRIAELQALKVELAELEQHVRHNLEECRPGQQVAACSYCPMIDEEGGEPNDSVSMPVR